MLLDLITEGLFFGLLAAVVAFFISPLQYLKIIRQDTGVTYSQVISDALSHKQPLKIFFRAALPYTLMNFLSNMSFGFSNHLSNLILEENYFLFTGVMLRSLLGGIIETILTIYPEIDEILKNKGDLKKNRKNNIIKISFPIFLRNSIAWVGTTLSYEILVKFSMGVGQSTIVSFIIGIIFGIISLPFDVITTQNCGSHEKLNSIQRFFRIVDQDKTVLLSGTIIRVLQISIFTVVTVLSMFLFAYVRTSL